MRFVANGPNIPDELLTARDAGQVIFFCGAGVSKAEASLPDFPTLAANVLDTLGSAQKSPARELLNSSKPSAGGIKPAGALAIDRVFNLLEREFEPVEVREAVAMALKPAPDCKLGPHKTLLDLSRTRSGVPRIVTTNFDLLFEACDASLESFNPPRLPDPGRPLDFRGIIHLHGRVDKDYRGARENEFVLSSADFGHAYLSNGWATRYIQALRDRFKIIFIGYSADDPPVQYLLEAMSRFGNTKQEIYAFHGGSPEEGALQWSHRGVEPITFDTSQGYGVLWDTLAAWAERARDVDGWHDRLIAKALQGPASLAPHERGMVAHLASSPDGARRLAIAQVSLPPEWLFVFDREGRYEWPVMFGRRDDGSVQDDPFSTRGLDSDPLPEPLNLDIMFARRAIPAAAWDAFEVTDADRRSLPANSVAHLSGASAPMPASLPLRLASLKNWIANIAHHPVTLWWAAEQKGLHPHLRAQIERSLRQADFSPAVREGWRLLFASPRDPASVDFRRQDIRAQAKVDGWSPALVREAVGLYRPVVSVRRSHSVPISTGVTELTRKDILSVGVDYSEPYKALQFPPETLAYAARLFRQHVEHAVQLEEELSGGAGLFCDTLRADDGETLAEDGHRVTGLLQQLVRQVSALSEVDLPSARKEVATWSNVDSPVFTRLRIWASSYAKLMSPEEAAETFIHLDDEAFWGSDLERDLLYAMRDRWLELPASAISTLEDRLRTGHFPWDENRNDRDELIAFYRLNRLHWLSSQGIKFSFDLNALISELRKVDPRWTEDASKYTARRRVGPVRGVETDTDPSALETLPLADVLPAAEAQEHHDFDSSVQRVPFRGFIQRHPIRALRALTVAAKTGDFSAARREWPTLLRADSDALRRTRVVAQIAARLARLPAEHLLQIGHAASEWMQTHSEVLLQSYPGRFGALWDALISVLLLDQESKGFHPPKRDWVGEGLNSIAGSMVEASFNAPWAKDTENLGLPETWRKQIEQLMALSADHRHRAIAILSHQLKWLFYRDPAWVEEHLLPFADQEGEDGHAFWAGFFSAAMTPPPPLYARLKPHFLALSSNVGLRQEHMRVLGGLLLIGWCGNEKAEEPKFPISDLEMREALIHGGDQFRVQVLHDLSRWTLEAPEQWNPRLLPFLTQVWPKQRAVRTERSSEALVRLAFELPDRFAEVAAVILRNLGKVGPHASIHVAFEGDDDPLLKRYPEIFLDLLWAVLSEDPSRWPYELVDLLNLLAPHPALGADPRLAELRRRQHQG